MAARGTVEAGAAKVCDWGHENSIAIAVAVFM